ncbi:four-carbon acid sugar kinase family protein [Conservatibacter flavescens]|uniref:Four-carbon acid sugar kinase family protein n=1 Tax=Conservatibacter flavescens TaxID=28161 RepID=A0A2M8S090_9PAST|nr:four-carbon acid sugar kinase family protein [Conservatibacter flavescens]PJG84572.1 hypothetical protein CVP05_10565 [Conservatibacter flavescens]
MKKESLFVIADDLTGANDTGIMFAEAGFSTILKMDLASLNTMNLDSAEVFSISTNSRAIGEQAAEATQQVVSVAIKNGINQIYLKIDSTMRGSVRYQIQGALQAWTNKYPNAKAIICCAYPDMGRTIENGHLLVNGVPVEQTASGQDAICPVLSSSMQVLLPDAELLACSTEDELHAQIMASDKQQFVIDAKTSADLNIIANVINQLGHMAIPVGSAGLAEKLKTPPELSKKKANIPLGRSLILVSSIHEVSQNQVDKYIASLGGKSIVFNPAPAQLLNHSVSNEALKQQLNALIESSSENVIIRANPTKYHSSESIHSVAKKIAEYLSELGLYCLTKQKFDSIILFGGDGAAALLKKMHVSELELVYALFPGVPLCRINDGLYKGIHIVTKSGGFGSLDLLTDMMK